MTTTDQMMENVSDVITGELAEILKQNDNDFKSTGKVLDIFRNAGCYKAPEEIDVDFIDSYTLMLEEIAVSCAGMAFLAAVPVLGSLPLALAGKTSKYTEYTSGEKYMGYALSGEDIVGEKKIIFTESDGGYTLNGKLEFMLLGSHAEAVVVPAYKEDEENSDCTLFFVDLSNIKVEDFPTLGLKAVPVAHLNLENVKVTKDDLIGDEGKGFDILRKTESVARIFSAAVSIGLIESALTNSIEYSKDRVQFGVSIMTFQGLQDLMVKMEIALFANEGMLTEVIGSFNSLDENDIISAARLKLSASAVAMQSATDAVQIYGGYGFMRDFPVEKLMRDAKMIQILFGNAHHLTRIVAESF